MAPTIVALTTSGSTSVRSPDGPPTARYISRIAARFGNTVLAMSGSREPSRTSSMRVGIIARKAGSASTVRASSAWRRRLRTASSENGSGSIRRDSRMAAAIIADRFGQRR